jgi:hypothetical protein
VRFESSITAVTWLPFEALDRMPTIPLELAVAHHDDPPGERLDDLDELRRSDAFREANELRAWIESDGDEIVAYGREGRALTGGSPIDLAFNQVAFPAVEFPVIRPEPEIGDGWARFTQTAGGRIGLPAPREVRGEPYFHFGSISAWTTLELTMHADGRAEHRLVSASPFPRHSLYGDDRALIADSGMVDFEEWYRESLGVETPWGGEQTPAFAAAVESELERALATTVLRSGIRMPRRRLEAGDVLVREGEPGDELFILLDGVLEVEVDGTVVAHVGSGAILGERAVLEGGRRTATLRAVRSSRVAVIGEGMIDRTALRDVALAHRREAT